MSVFGGCVVLEGLLYTQALVSLCTYRSHVAIETAFS